MGKDNKTNKENLIEKLLTRISGILIKVATWTGFVLIVIALVLEFASEKLPIVQDTFHIMASISTTLGATFLSVALINVIYQQWHDELMNLKIEDIPRSVKNEIQIPITTISDNVSLMALKIDNIPNSVKKEIQPLITQISANVVNELYPYVPLKIYPPSREEPAEEDESEFKSDLVNSMQESKTYSYSGVDMTIASRCITKLYEEKLHEKKPFPYINSMLFIISDPNPNNGEADIIKERKKKDRTKLINSIKAINSICSHTGYKIYAVFYILPNRPPLHIHKTERLCFWGVVDKTGQWECPTTYCYKKIDNDLSMFKTIEDLIEQTKKRVDDKLYPSLKFEIISWEGQKKETNDADNNTITYKYKNKEITVSIEQFVENMKINQRSVRTGRRKKCR